ncbi:MAG: hypothetical protein GKR90_16920 [Pseudomonadales bacterium]|nr:hypothetical protein [Pseudomonadales bacterium]
MLIAHTPTTLHPQLDQLRYQQGKRRTIALVTTRGELHDGHGAVINAAATVSDHVVVAKMPMTVDQDENVVSATEFQDISFSDRHQADVVYAPTATDLFPQGTDLAEEFPFQVPLSELEHDAVALLTHLKIINAVQPDIMVWGERNFVEYAQVKALIKVLDIRTQLHCVPTVRHSNGTAVATSVEDMDTETAATAQVIYQTLENVTHVIRSGGRNFENIRRTARTALKGAGFAIAYFEILDEQTLANADEQTESFRLICQVTLGDITIADGMGLTL